MVRRREILKNSAAIGTGLVATSEIVSGDHQDRNDPADCSNTIRETPRYRYEEITCGEEDVILKVKKDSNKSYLAAEGQEARELKEDLQDGGYSISTFETSNSDPLVEINHRLEKKNGHSSNPCTIPTVCTNYYMATDIYLSEKASTYGGDLLSGAICHLLGGGWIGTVFCALVNTVITEEIYDGQYSFTLGLMDVDDPTPVFPPGSAEPFYIDKPMIVGTWAPYGGASWEETAIFRMATELVSNAVVLAPFPDPPEVPGHLEPILAKQGRVNPDCHSNGDDSDSGGGGSGDTGNGDTGDDGTGDDGDDGGGGDDGDGGGGGGGGTGGGGGGGGTGGGGGGGGGSCNGGENLLCPQSDEEDDEDQ